MKRMLLLCVCAIIGLFSAFMSTPVLANQASSVVEGDWIHSALVELQAGRSIPDFSIGSEMTRYQGAMLVAKLIQYIDGQESSGFRRFGVSKDILLAEMILEYNNRIADSQRLTALHIELLYQLSYEFLAELEVLGYAVTDYSIIASYSRNTLTLLSDRRLTYSDDALVTAKNMSGNALVTPSPAEEASEFPLSATSFYSALSEVKLVTTESEPIASGESFWDSLKVASNIGVATESSAVGSKDGVEGNIPLGKDLLLGASYVPLPSGDEDSSPGIASLAGQYAVTPDVTLEGRLLHNTETQTGGGGMQLGATVNFGEMEVSGIYRALQSGFQSYNGYASPSVGGGQSYGLSLKLGDLSLRTEYDRFAWADFPEPRLTSTSIDVSYGLANSVLVNAGIKHIDSEDNVASELGIPNVATIGVEFPIPRGRFSVGVRSESGASGVSSVSLDDEEAQLDSLTRKTAELGLSYTINSDTSLRFNYQFIDFSNVDQRVDEQAKNVASAEFSVKF